MVTGGGAAPDCPDDIAAEWNGRDGIQPDPLGDRGHWRIHMVFDERVTAGRAVVIDRRNDRRHANDGWGIHLYSSIEGQLRNNRDSVTHHNDCRSAIDCHDNFAAGWNGRDGLQSDACRIWRNRRIYLVGGFGVVAGGFEFVDGRDDQRHADDGWTLELYGSSKR